MNERRMNLKEIHCGSRSKLYKAPGIRSPGPSAAGKINSQCGIHMLSDAAPCGALIAVPSLKPASGIERDTTQPLPEDAAAAAAEFLTRLARHGLIEFLPDDKASDPRPERFLEALETVRLSGRTNMLDHPEVTRLTAEMGYPEVAEWLVDHRRKSATFVLEGTRPLGKNFGGKEDPAPCADK